MDAIHAARRSSRDVSTVDWQNGPLMNAASSLAKKATAAATSSGVGTRRFVQISERHPANCRPFEHEPSIPRFRPRRWTGTRG
jgi:hypothetical protein